VIGDKESDSVHAYLDDKIHCVSVGWSLRCLISGILSISA
jgi:hypothetical protein